MSSVLQRPIAIPPGGGTTLKFLGLTHKLTSAETGGAYYLCETVLGPERGTPLHIHHYEDEVIYVLDGEIEIRLDNKNLRAPAEGIVHLPKKIPHAFRNPLLTPLRILVYAIPGGLENYFNEVEAALQSGSFDNEVHQKISRKYGLEWLE